MKIKNVLLFAALLTTFIVATVSASGPYTSEILPVQSTKLSSPYNVVFLKLDISDSPCGGTNQFNRFHINSEEQQTAIFLAAAQGKQISIFGTGTCNVGDIELISAVRYIPQSLGFLAAQYTI